MPRVYKAWIQWAVMLCGVVAFAYAQPRAAGVIKVAKVVGEVYVTDATTSKVRLAATSLVSAGQVVETGPSSSVILVLSNGALINLRANSQLAVDQFLQDPIAGNFNIGTAVSEPSTSATRLELRKGEVISQVKKLNREAGSSFTVATPVGAAGIRGTAFKLGFIPRGTAARFVLSMSEGLIQFIPLRGRAVEVGAGKELSFDSSIDPTTGAVVSIPDMPALVDVASTDAAEVQTLLLETIAAAANIEFAPNPAAGSPVASVTGGTETAPVGVASPAPVGETVPAPSASPAPLPDPQRTTPASGE